MTTAATAPVTTADATTTVTPDGTTTGTDAQDGKGQAATKPDGTNLDGTTSTATAKAQEDVFFDPKDLSEELKPAYKQMQSAFTKKMQAVAKSRNKIDAYDAFERDPVGTMQKIAGQMGYQLTRAEAKAAVAAASTNTAADWQPNSWDEVFTKIEERIMGKVNENLKPVFDGVQKVTASNIEKQLDDIDPAWRMYEDDMKATIQAHPSLVHDVGKLYRISVPEEVLSSRAVQTALKKLEQKGQAAAVHGSSTATRTQPAAKKATSFQEAVQQARDQLEKGKK